MTVARFYSISIFLGFYSLTNHSCDTKSIIRNNQSKPGEVKTLDSLQFDFSAAYMSGVKQTVKIRATLFNRKKDTVYFLTSSCEGDQYSLIYDTLNFKLTPVINCNASFPKLNKIAPNGRYDFKAQFISNAGTIKLGFDFYQVDKPINLSKIKLADIHNRQTDKQTIIWAKNKIIK